MIYYVFWYFLGGHFVLCSLSQIAQGYQGSTQDIFQTEYMCKQNHTYIKITICSSISYLLGSHFENGGHFEFENTRNRFSGSNTLEFMYRLTICVNFQRIYGIFCISIKLRPPFCFMLIISNSSRVTAIHPIDLSYRIFWQPKSIKKNYRRQIRVDHVGA